MDQIPKEIPLALTDSAQDSSESESIVNKTMDCLSAIANSIHNPTKDCIQSSEVTNIKQFDTIDRTTNGKHCPPLPQTQRNQLHTERSNLKSSDKLDTRAAEAAAAKAAPVPGRCQLYLPRKRRYCRSVPNVGKKYCVEHSVVSICLKVDVYWTLCCLSSLQYTSLHRMVANLKEVSDRKRIQCPLDPKHSCYEDQLTSHLKKCNARREALPIYYVENLNAGDIEDGEGAKVTVSAVEPDEIKMMIAKVNQLYEDKVKSIKEEILCHVALQEEIDKPSNGPAAQKHLKQQASLVGHVDKHGLLHDECCYIEFGAGKAGLSHWVQRAQDTCNNTKFVLVDKSSVRYKMDVYHRGEDQGPDFERLRIDIQHLDLNKVPSLLNNRLPLVGLGKHLCGGATDLMLRCLMQTVQETTSSNQKNPYVEGLVLALCCHHRCDWRSFVGKQIMRDWGVGPCEFSLMTSMTSWATCATRTFLQKLKEREAETGSTTSQQEEHGPGDEEDDKPYNHPRYGSLTPEDREEVGFKCKKLLDMARVYYLREHGFNAELLLYAQLEHTLENVVLIANNSKQPEQQIADPDTGAADP